MAGVAHAPTSLDTALFDCLALLEQRLLHALRLISPVIAMSWRTGRSVNSEASEMNIATPALGPSFGIAPAGMCR